MNRRIISAIALLAVASLHISQGQAQDSFYKGKIITILAGTGAGNVYDIFARLFARHMRQAHPGQSGHHRAKHARRGIDDRYAPLKPRFISCEKPLQLRWHQFCQ